jgi:hypothetical protein
MTLADTAVELGDATALGNYAPELEKLASRDHHNLYLAIAHRALGVWHRLNSEQAAAERRLNQALELFTQLGAGWQIGRTLFELGEVYAASSATNARECYSQALSHFEKVSATPYAERTQAALVSLG